MWGKVVSSKWRNMITVIPSLPQEEVLDIRLSWNLILSVVTVSSRPDPCRVASSNVEHGGMFGSIEDKGVFREGEGEFRI